MREVIDIHVHHPGRKDPGMDACLEAMGRCGVVKALVLGLDSGSYDWMGGNDDVLRAVRRHPDRLAGGIYIDLRDPRRKTIATIERYAAAGFRFVKMFPNFGFDPNDDAHEPVWKVVEKLGLGCLSHCGWLGGDRRLPRHSLTATPFHFETPARRHPGVNFVFGHFGGAANYLETIVLTSRLDNCYADVTPGWGKWVFAQRLPGLKDLRMSQILYGTDSAVPHYTADIPWWSRTLRALGYGAADQRAFFHDNAARLLGP